MKNNRFKIYILIFLQIISFTFLTANVLAIGSKYSNQLLRLDIKNEGSNNVNIILFTTKSYNLKLFPIKKSDDEYVIFLPETYHSITSSPDFSSCPLIKHVDVKLVPYMGIQSNNGYVKIVIKTKEQNIKFNVIDKIYKSSPVLNNDLNNLLAFGNNTNKAPKTIKIHPKIKSITQKKPVLKPKPLIKTKIIAKSNPIQSINSSRSKEKNSAQIDIKHPVKFIKADLDNVKKHKNIRENVKVLNKTELKSSLDKKTLTSINKVENPLKNNISQPQKEKAVKKPPKTKLTSHSDIVKNVKTISERKKESAKNSLKAQPISNATIKVNSPQNKSANSQNSSPNLIAPFFAAMLIFSAFLFYKRYKKQKSVLNLKTLDSGFYILDFLESKMLNPKPDKEQNYANIDEEKVLTPSLAIGTEKEQSEGKFDYLNYSAIDFTPSEEELYSFKDILKRSCGFLLHM